MVKSIVLFLFFPLLLCFAQQENQLPEAKPEEVGMSSVRLGKIKPLMQKYVDEHKLPGMVTMVARHGKIVHYEKYGLMDADKPMRRDAIFRIASMTKSITSTAVLILYDEGLLRLDDPVAKYIPEFQNLKVFSSIDKNGIHLVKLKRPITIRNLLTHTSGLASGADNTPVDSMYRAANLSAGTLKEMIQKLAAIPLLYQPGTIWHYSRSTDVLGYLVEAVSGNPFDVFLKEKLFLPLKMKDTGFYVPMENFNRVGAVYTRNPSGGMDIAMKPEISNVSIPVKFLSGNGGLVSTAADYMIFSQMLLNKGEYNGVRILKSKTVELMTSNQLSHVTMPDDDFFGPLLDGMGFGLGVAVVRETHQSKFTGSIGSYWWAGTANTYFYVDPRKDFIAIFMTQFVPSNYYPITKEFRELVYRSIVQ
ncbi:MAG: class A beta-lactamase-related serine hydrolase [Ignavibacteriae bacterium]|nr:MAG: class A beta-lactamase-related serine hydrolase [Ignavibacteriota bacterium]